MFNRRLYCITEAVVLGIVEGASELKAGDLVSRSGSVTSKNVGFTVFSIKQKTLMTSQVICKDIRGNVGKRGFVNSKAPCK